MKLLKTYSTSGIILFLLSLVYLGAEFVFNRQLLDISSSVRSDPDQVEHIQYFGRMASGLGFTLLVLGVFQQFGFKIIKRKQWLIFSLIALLCLTPFILTFAQTLLAQGTENDVPYTEGMIWGFVPFTGLYIVLVSGGKRPFVTVLGLIILAWPAMFYGQKLAVERFIISPTTAEDRLNAHYILLLRSGIEDCVISLEGTKFCDDGGDRSDVEKRATRAVMGSLFMLNTTAVFNGLSFSRDQILDSITARDMWFSSGDYYQRYLQEVAEKRQQYAQFLDDQYYQPYKQASDLYQKTYNNAVALYMQASQQKTLEKMAEDASQQIANETDRDWQKYENAIVAYNNATIGMVSRVGQTVAEGQNLYSSFCQNHRSACDRLSSVGNRYVNTNVDDTIAQMQQEAADKFYDQTGYTPDIKDERDFLQAPKTQEMLRAGIEKKIREKIPGYQLPPQWTYDPATFKSDFLRMMQDQAQNKALEIANTAQKTWHDKVQAKYKTNIQPGLSREDFFKYLGLDPLPPLSDLVMSENDFREKYIMPMNREVADAALEGIRDEAPSYANRQELAEQGKDYIRVLYIPAIALCLSILIVVITIGRFLTATATNALKNARMLNFMTRRQRNIIRPVCWAAYLVLALGLPYQWSNPYTSTAAYQKYLRLAREKAPVTAQLLDWVVHVQPIIYRAGAHVPGVTRINQAIF